MDTNIIWVSYVGLHGCDDVRVGRRDMEYGKKVGVVGATGAVGMEMVNVSATLLV